MFCSMYLLQKGIWTVAISFSECTLVFFAKIRHSNDIATVPVSFCNIIISSQFPNLGGHQATTDDVATIPFHPSLSSAVLRESPNPIPIHSLMLSSYLFFCLPLLLAPFTVPCRTVFAMPEDLEMWLYHLSFHFFTMVRRSSCTPFAFWILL